MFDIGMTEMLVVGVVALIVVGPKDLPVMFRRVGQFVGKAKGMAREFSSAMNDAADQSGVRDVTDGLNKSLKAATNPIGTAMDSVKDAASSLTNIDPESETGKLSAERAEAGARIQANSARMAADRKAREAKEALDEADALEASLNKSLAKEPKPTAAPKTKSKTAVKPAKKPAAKPVKKAAPKVNKTPAQKKADT